MEHKNKNKDVFINGLQIFICITIRNVLSSLEVDSTIDCSSREPSVRGIRFPWLIKLMVLRTVYVFTSIYNKMTCPGVTFFFISSELFVIYIFAGKGWTSIRWCTRPIRLVVCLLRSKYKFHGFTWTGLEPTNDRNQDSLQHRCGSDLSQLDSHRTV